MGEKAVVSELGDFKSFWPNSTDSTFLLKTDIKKNEIPVAPISFKNARLSRSEIVTLSFWVAAVLSLGLADSKEKSCK